MNPFQERKILGHLPILGQYLSGGEYPPIQVELDLTNACTSACSWCAGYKDREQHPYVLFGSGSSLSESFRSSRQQVFDLILDLSNAGVKSITWTGGGDPSLHPNLEEFINESHNLGMDNGLITNGVIDVSGCIPYCKWIRFSVDAATEVGYGKQHGRPHHFSRVIENVTKAAKMKGTTTIGVGFVTAVEVIDEIEMFPGMWADVPVSYIQFRPIMDNYGRHYDVDHQEIVRRVRNAQLLDSRVVCSDAKYNALERGDTGMTMKCHGTFLETAIAADGCVYACCHLKSLPQYSIGSLHEESFQSIWSRHLSNRDFNTTSDCTRWCRHFSTNSFLENDVLIHREHGNFI